MKEKTIELELRAEVLSENLKSIKSRLENLGTLHSHTKRLSIMYFGAIEEKKIDIRVRVTNGQSEVVIKSGSFGAHDRVEIAQPISLDQFIGFVRIFAQFGFTAKVGERETFNYSLSNDVVASLVIAGTIAYIELEKMSLPEEVKGNIQELKNIAEQLKLTLIDSENQFDELCGRLDKTVDWPFNCSTDECKRIEEILREYAK